GSGAAVCRPLLRAAATPHVWRRRRRAPSVGSSLPGNTARIPPRRGTPMRIATTQIWVHDQDVALDFYTNKLGMEVREDVTLAELGDFRWLTVGMPGQPDVAIVLMMVPGPPVFDAETAEQIRTLVAKGGCTAVFLTTDDCQASYEKLKAQGVEFTEEP